MVVDVRPYLNSSTGGHVNVSFFGFFIVGYSLFHTLSIFNSLMSCIKFV